MLAFIICCLESSVGSWNIQIRIGNYVYRRKKSTKNLMNNIAKAFPNTEYAQRSRKTLGGPCDKTMSIRLFDYCHQ